MDTSFFLKKLLELDSRNYHRLYRINFIEIKLIFIEKRYDPKIKNRAEIKFVIMIRFLNKNLI